jgi:protein TonB
VSAAALPSRPQLQRVPLAAIGLALLMHAAIAVALWWMAPGRPPDIEDRPVMLTFDRSPSATGLQLPQRAGPPPASELADRPAASDPTAPPPQELAARVPDAAAEASRSLPLFEFSVPPLTSTPPPPTSRDFARPARAPSHRAERLASARPHLAVPARPPAEQPASMPSPVPGPEPGDVLGRQGRQRNDYLARVFRHLQPYRAQPLLGNRPRGRVVTRVTVARDGRVIEVMVASSSGSQSLDAAEVAAIRRAAPFPPLPAGMPGDPVILILPITY